MAWRCGSLSRSLISSARSSASPFRSSAPSVPRALRQHPSAAPRFQSTRRMSLSPTRMGELGCTQSLLPPNSAVGLPRLTSHLSVAVRACCELSHGMEKMGDAPGVSIFWRHVKDSDIVLEGAWDLEPSCADDS